MSEKTPWRGKVVGNNWYVHKDYVWKLPPGIPEQYGEILLQLSKHMMYSLMPLKKSDYDVVKLCVDHGCVICVSFLKVYGWDELDEPILQRSIIVYPGFQVKVIDYINRDPPVYHHKWTMVLPDYKGFDYKKSQARSHEWASNPVVAAMMKKDPHFKSRIGYKSYWDNVCKEAGI
jgi:hypothetical protein